MIRTVLVAVAALFGLRILLAVLGTFVKLALGVATIGLAYVLWPRREA